MFIDSRIGSKDLAPQLKQMGVPVELTTLEFGDIAFVSKDGKSIGIELKKLPDLVQSLRDGRLSGHQLPGLMKSFDCSFLLIEGQYSTDAMGQMCTRVRLGWKQMPGQVRTSEIEKRVLTLELNGGLRTRYTNTRADTLHWLVNLYRWFTDKGAEQHTSHLHQHDVPQLITVSDFRAAVMKWPGIGRKASLAVEKAFINPLTGEPSLLRACQASVEDWAGITTKDDKGKTKKLGIRAAERILQFVRGT